MLPNAHVPGFVRSSGLMQSAYICILYLGLFSVRVLCELRRSVCDWMAIVSHDVCETKCARTHVDLAISIDYLNSAFISTGRHLIKSLCVVLFYLCVRVLECSLKCCIKCVRLALISSVALCSPFLCSFDGYRDALMMVQFTLAFVCVCVRAREWRLETVAIAACEHSSHSSDSPASS